MSTSVPLRFRIRDRGGKLAGATIEKEVPGFDWRTFVKCPNAPAFAEKAYIQAQRKIAREIEEGSNRRTSAVDLTSMESVLVRSLEVPRKELEDWLDRRDWNRVGFKDADRSVPRVRELLGHLQAGRFWHVEQWKQRLAEIVATVADAGSDPIADWLFSRLTPAEDRYEKGDLVLD